MSLFVEQILGLCLVMAGFGVFGYALVGRWLP